MSVLQMTRVLAAQPEIPARADVTVRHYGGPDDIEIWLEIRQQAFRDGPIPARKWAKADFQAELLDRWWWRPERMWLAEIENRTVGTVTLGQRGPEGQSRPVVHWLAVVPSARRRGIARLLMAHLEGACWSSGWRQVWLETHDQWRAAVALYRSLGYEVATGEA